MSVLEKIPIYSPPNMNWYTGRNLKHGPGSLYFLLDTPTTIKIATPQDNQHSPKISQSYQ